MDNPLFKLILVEEIKRKAMDMSVADFYNSLPEDELKFQLICVDATLSRGSLPLVEKYLLKKGKDPAFIKNKVDEMSDYDFYSTTERIYNRLLENMEEKQIPPEKLLVELLEEAVNGELENL